jgi:hypothetical protein
MVKIGLDDLAETYARVQRSISRGMEDAAEFDNEAAFDLFNTDQAIIDAGFFVLIFGQLENHVNTLARENTKDPKHKDGVRKLAFEKRLGIALGTQGALRTRIEGWYKVRNDVAHGESITSGYDIEAVLKSARAIESLLATH